MITQVLDAKTSSPLVFALCGFALLVFNVLQSTCAQLLLQNNTKTTIDIRILVFWTEFLKLFISFLVVVYVYCQKSTPTPVKLFPTKKTVFAMIVPAILYTMSSIMTYQSIQRIGSASFQIWSNIRIIITALLCRILIQQTLTILQWLSIVLLALGVVISTPALTSGTKMLRISMEECFLIFAQTFFSSLAGVYQEIVFKKEDQHIAVKNAFLYLWTCFFLFSNIFWDSFQNDEKIAFFEYFSYITILCIMVYALYGQVVSLTLFFCNNFVKVFANSLGGIAALGIDSIILKRDFYASQLVGAIIVIISTFLFYVSPSFLIQSDIDVVRARKK